MLTVRVTREPDESGIRTSTKVDREETDVRRSNNVVQRLDINTACVVFTISYDEQYILAHRVAAIQPARFDIRDRSCDRIIKRSVSRSDGIEEMPKAAK